MSPQFVDFNADGHLDIVAGTFDGSPHVAFGTDKGWKQPEQILDREGQRIMLNQFWNFDSKKWDNTTRCDPQENAQANGHLTSAVAMDWDGNGVLDLLLGDHRSGRIYRRMNEGSAAAPKFATKNVQIDAAGKPIDVPGTVATMRLVDWNHDGLLDLLCGGMGDAYSESGEGGGVFLFLNKGSKTKPSFAAPLVVVAPSKKGAVEGPTRPDSGIYIDLADCDGDGDLDLVVGGYSHWMPKAPVLTQQQKARVAVLQAELEEWRAKSTALGKSIGDATKGLDEEAAKKKRTELVASQKEERAALAKKHTAIQQELDPLLPGAKRNSYVWLYENVSAKSAPAKAGG